MAQSMAALPQGGIPLPDKKKSIQDILDKLERDLESPALSDDERDSMLERLKVFGRNPQGCDAIFAKKGIEVLARQGFHVPSRPYNRQALRCLANAMFLKPEARGTLVELGFASNACTQMAQDVEDEFLGARILFLSTYATKEHLVDLVENHQLAETITKNLKRHAERQRSAGPQDPIEGMALTDTLNLLYNATAFLSGSNPDTLECFLGAVPHIISMLKAQPIPSPKPLEQPIDKLVNALTNLDMSRCSDVIYPSHQPLELAERLVRLLEKGFTAYSESEREVALSPISTLVLKLLPSAPPDIRAFFQSRLLPSSSDRSQALGQGDSLADKILQNTTNALAPNLREALGHVLFELSEKDATRFVDNVGYGFASGYLFQHQIPVPESVREAHAEPSTGRPVNPITGQFMDQERETSSMPEMTDAEREREAERLFVLFERLRQTGVVDVENPVRQAYQSGRIQELDSDGEDERD